MSQQLIDIGVLPDDRLGDSLRAAGQKINANFTELYPSYTRTRLSGNVTLYVATTGNDSNTGLTIGSPFLTIQKAVDVAYANYIVPFGFTVTIQMADGTYSLSSAVTIRSDMLGTGITTRHLIINGNSGTPANVIVQNSTSHCFLVYRSFVEFTNFEMRCTAAGSACMWSEAGGRISIGSGIRFGASAAAQAHINLFYGSYCFSSGHTISGGSARHVNLQFGSTLRVNGTLTFSGTPTFSSTLLQAQFGSLLDLTGAGYSGSITGSQYSVAYRSTVASVNTIPGTAGAVSNGGRLVTISRR